MLETIQWLANAASWRLRKVKNQVENQLVKYFVLPVIYSKRLKRSEPQSQTGEKPCFLILRYKYWSGSEHLGTSDSEKGFVTSLRSANIGSIVEYYYDLDYPGGILGERGLIDIVTRVRPDLIFLSSYDCFDYRHPRFEVLKTIREKCKIPIIAVWWDSTNQLSKKQLTYMFDQVDLNLLIDSGALTQDYPSTERFLRLWAPIDPKFFGFNNGERDIPVSFVGSIGAYRSIRNEYLIFLREHNVNIYHTGGKTEQAVSLEKYAEILRRSKISLNISDSVGGTHQLKARVFEILLSGALLLESENNEIKEYFTPMIDYVNFESKPDLLEKVRYFLEHEDERKIIALKGYEKARTCFNNQVFWLKVADKMMELNLLSVNRLRD